MIEVYPLVSGLYLAIPAVAAIAAVFLRRRNRTDRPVHVFVRAASLGAALGVCVAFVYASMGRSRLPGSQFLPAIWIGIAALCVVYGINDLVRRAANRILRIRDGSGGALRHAAAGGVQAALLVLIGFPYLGSLLLLYRPGTVGPGDPMSLIDAPFQTVHFRASDGVPLEAWWIPATRNSRTDGRGADKHGRATVVLCHGFSSDRSRDLFLAADLVANGYNVLAPDLRAHGRSGGRFTGLGAVEGRDVLGAVRYLREVHPDESRRIVGVGEGLGAVALIEAAADPGPDGRAIQAIAAYNPYDDLGRMLDDAGRQYAVPAAQWVFRHAILPVASAQLGVRLTDVSPAEALRKFWPRPLLVLGNPVSHSASYGRSFDLYEAAFQPKYSYFRDDLLPQDLLHDRTAALTVRVFLDEARPFL